MKKGLGRKIIEAVATGYKELVSLFLPTHVIPPRIHMGLNKISERVCGYLNNPTPKGALLVCGDWGAGKSYFLTTNRVSIENATKKRFITVSVAGLQSRAEIDRAMFAASAPALFSGYASAASIFLKAGLRFVHIDPQDFKFEASLQPGEIVVVLEDFDRYGGSSETLAGLVIDLVDQNRVHTIVVADDEKLYKLPGNFGEWKEKVIAHSIRLKPNLERRFVELRNGIASIFSRERISRHERTLLAITKNWGMSNLRIMEHAVNELSEIIDQCGGALNELGEWEEVLISGLYLGILEIRRDAQHKKLISGVFSHDGLSDAAQARLAGMTDIASDAGEDQDSASIKRLMSRYDSFEFSLFPGGRVFSEYFNYGLIDAPRMISAFDRVMARKTRRQIFIDEYFSLSQPDFDSEYESICDDLSNGRIYNLGTVGKAFVAMQFMVERKVVPLTEAELTDLFLRGIGAVAPEKVADPEDNDDIWYALSSDSAVAAIKEALASKRLQSRAITTETARLSVLKSQPDGSFGVKLADWQLKPLFIGDSEELIAALESLTPSEVQDVMRLFGSRRRVSNYMDFLSEEKAVLLVIAERLKRSPDATRKLTIKDSQLNSLSSVIFEFAQTLR